MASKALVIDSSRFIVFSRTLLNAAPVMGWRWYRISQGFRDADKHRRDGTSRFFGGVGNTFEGAQMRGSSVPPSCVGQHPKNGLFWAWFGRLSRLAQKTIGDSETQRKTAITEY
jgi:hypothetical protein